MRTECPECIGEGFAATECHVCNGRGIVDLAEVAAQHGALVRADQADEPDRPPLDEHALVAAFKEAEHLPALRPPSNERERRAIGTSVAEYLLSAREGESADLAAMRVVARLGKHESMALADVLAKWSLALAAIADKAPR